MKYFSFYLTLIFLLLIISGCSTTGDNKSSEMATPFPQETLAIESTKNNDIQNCFVLIVDENKEVPVMEHIVFDEKNNAVAGIPSGVGGNIQLVIKGTAYDVCWGYDDLWLEKEGRAYSLWENDLQGIAEAAADLSIEEIYRYLITADEKSAAVDDSCTDAIFNMLAIAHDTMHVVTDVTGSCVRFTNKLGANFDYYPESHAIFSQHANAYLDIIEYYEDLDGIIAVLQ